jgi:hypothetical protein
MEAWQGLIGALTGVIVSWFLTVTTQTVMGRREADSKLNKAAFVCFERLLKIQYANNRSDTAQRDSEIYYLGKDMDAYRDCIAASSKRKRSTHWAIYQRMIPILLEHDMRQLNSLVADLEDFLG